MNHAMDHGILQVSRKSDKRSHNPSRNQKMAMAIWHRHHKRVIGSVPGSKICLSSRPTISSAPGPTQLSSAWSSC